MDSIAAQIERWRRKAEELRTTADNVANPFARASFLRMAETYERLAEDFRNATRGTTPDHHSKAG